MTETTVIERYCNEGLTDAVVAAFRNLVLSRYRDNPRPLPWRETRYPYAILVSEVMLQQTRVERVSQRYPAFLARFPDVATLANAPLAEVLAAWQGLGYNRRGVALKRAAEEIVSRYGGVVPAAPEELVTLPGIGPYTAGAIAAFAFGAPTAFIETNIRSVYLHFFFGDRSGVADRELAPFVTATMDGEDPRHWYYALMDYGVALKKRLPNPSRRSRHHAVQSPFRGSNREVRGAILKTLLASPGIGCAKLAELTGKDPERVGENLRRLETEGFIVQEEGERYRVR